MSNNNNKRRQLSDCGQFRRAIVCLWLASGLAGAVMPVMADTEADQSPYEIVSVDGRFHFKMVPGSGDREKSGHGICYRVSSDGHETVLWETTGWFAFRTFLADGDFLVRLGNHPRGQALSVHDLAVAFYKDGYLLKSYSTKDLVRDPLAVPTSVSHYSFLSDRPWLEGRVFILQTIDHVVYSFDVCTGKILHARTEQPKPFEIEDYKQLQLNGADLLQVRLLVMRAKTFAHAAYLEGVRGAEVIWRRKLPIGAKILPYSSSTRVRALGKNKIAISCYYYPGLADSPKVEEVYKWDGKKLIKLSREVIPGAWELYSWSSGGNWRFALVTAPILKEAPICPPFKILSNLSLEELERELRNFHKGQAICLRTSKWIKSEMDATNEVHNVLRFPQSSAAKKYGADIPTNISQPPSETIDRLKQLCKSLDLRLQILPDWYFH